MRRLSDQDVGLASVKAGRVGGWERRASRAKGNSEQVSTGLWKL